MKRELRILPTAEADLADLFDFIRFQSGRNRAVAYVQRLRDFCLTLPDFPERGRRRNDLHEGLRSLSVDRRAIIVYRVDVRWVEVVHIYYAGRDYGPDDFIQ